MKSFRCGEVLAVVVASAGLFVPQSWAQEEWFLQSHPRVSESEVSCRLSRVNVLFGGFAELQLGVFSLEVQPYVELRFNRR